MTKAKKKLEEKKETKEDSKVITATFEADKVLTEISNEARELYDQSRYGALLENGKVQLSLIEAFYLMDRGKLEIYKSKNKKFTSEEFARKARKLEPNFWVKYCVFKDIRNRGYIIKTALKFGADFRVYDRGVKPGE